MDFGNLMFEYGWIVVLLMGVGGYFWYYFKVNGKQAGLKELRERAYQLMLLAEKKFADGDGEAKMAWVADKIWLLLPDTMKFVLSEEDLTKLLQELYEELEDFLDDGELNDSNE